MRRAIFIAAVLALAVVTTGCRCLFIAGDNNHGLQVAPKTYDDVMNGNTNTLDVPLLGK